MNNYQVTRCEALLKNPSVSNELRMVAEAIVAMASALGMTTVAEGVETAAQEARLIQLGCHAAQGYFYSRPEPAEQVIATVRALTGPSSGVFE